MIDLFPENADHFPILYEDKDMKYLNGSNFKNCVEAVKLEIDKYYSKLCKIIPDFRRDVLPETFVMMWC